MEDSAGKLIVRLAGQQPREFELGPAALTIGRDAACDVKVESPYVSRRHARVEPHGASFLLVELGSANPTLVNGERMSGKRVLAPGDTISIADVTIEYWQPPADPEMTAIFMPPVADDTAEVKPDLSRTEQIRIREMFAMRGTLTIMFTDLVDSTAIRTELGDARAQEYLRTHNAILRKQFAEHNGLEVKGQGDGFMVMFTSARMAVRCAIGIQRALEAYNAGEPAVPIRVRIGLNLGEVISEDDDFFGSAVNMAARVASEAGGGQVLVSGLLQRVIAPAGEFETVSQGQRMLKGFHEPAELFAVEWQEAASQDDAP